MRLSCELEVHYEILPSPTCEGANSRQPKCKATLTLGKKGIGSKGKGAGREDACLIAQTSRHPSGIQYKVVKNVRKVHAKFAAEGKATIRFHDPPHTLSISKADPVQLKTLLNVLKVTLAAKAGAQEGEEDIALSTIDPTAKLKDGDLPKSRLTIRDKSAYPLTPLPASLEHFEAVGINLGRMDTRVCHLKHLRHLDLSNNQISIIPDALKDCQLCELRLSGNKIEAFPAMLCSGPFASSIRTMDLSRNQIKALPNNISQLSSLLQLRLDCNLLTHMPRNFGKLQSLKFFSASGNQLKALPHSFSRLSLESVDLFGNPFQPVGVVSRQGDLSLPCLKELAARVVRGAKVAYDATFVPVVMCHYLDSAHKCLCGSACFEVYLHHMAALNLRHVAATVTAVDKDGTLTVPVEMFLCKARCLKLWKKSTS